MLPSTRMLVGGLILLAVSSQLYAVDTDVQKTGEAVVAKAINYLKSQQQPNGTWQTSPRVPPAVTAMAIRVIAQDPNHGPRDPAVLKGVEALLKLQKPDGGLYDEALANYNTAIIVSGLVSLNDPQLRPVIDGGVAFLRGTQWADDIVGPDGQKLNPQGVLSGGWFYGKIGDRGGPAADLSNTAVMLDALRDAGLPPDDPAFQNALKFVTRMQNRSESNPADWAGNDGGFVYHMRHDGSVLSAAGEYTGVDGRTMHRSYGSMTYAGFMSMIYAGLTRDDPRVQAAWNWISENYTLEENPGMAQASPSRAQEGLYYYYNVMAKALSVHGERTITDGAGEARDWRADLIVTLAARQNEDGSFAGERRWMESNPIIATTLGVLAVQDALKELKQPPVSRNRISSARLRTGHADTGGCDQYEPKCQGVHAG